MAAKDSVEEDEWPPHCRENPDLAGQEKAEKTLIDAYTSGRLVHAWLITGLRGIGKATLAFRFARYLFAQSRDEGGLFGDALEVPTAGTLYQSPESPLFHRVASGGHADLLTVERSLNEKGKLRSEIVVDDVRDISAFMRLTAAEGGWRVAIIDGAEDMNPSAANAVLKILEEPPPRSLLLLISHNPGRLLPTIRSRCRRLQLPALEMDVLTDLIAKYGPDVPVEDRERLARLAEGSVGRALTLAGEGGLEIYQDLVGLLETLPNLDVPALHALGDRVGKAGADDAFRAVGELVRWWLGRLILLAAGSSSEGYAAEEKALGERLAGPGNLDRWLEVWEKINRLLARADSANLDRKQVVLNVFLALESAARS